MREPPTHLLYLHGFRSSPRSFKAQRLQAWLRAHRPGIHWWCPQLPPSPREAWQLMTGGIATWPDTSAVLGSSLGGFYATAVAERTGWLWDPVAMTEARRVFADDLAFACAGTPMATLEGADALLIATEWKEFRSPDFEAIRTALKQSVIFDGRNLYEPRVLRDLGFEYFAIGR